jgi:NitT/TauT family transport system substrate-binding protein
VISKHGASVMFSIALVSLLMTSSTYASAKLRIGWVYAMANAPALIAQEKGFFNAQGLNVDLRRFNSGPLIIHALEAGDLDMAYIGVPPVYSAYENGLDVKIVSKVNYGHAALIVNRQSPIRSLQDLRGKKIASVRRGSGMDILLRGFILKQKAGLDPDKDVNIVSMPSKMMEASVHRNIVDAAFTWEPYVSIAVLTGHERVLLDMNELVPRYPWYVLIATGKICKNRREELQQVLRANQQAIEYLNNQRDASNLILVREFNLRAIVTATGSEVSPVDIVNNARKRLGWESRFSQGDKAFLQKLMDYSHQLGFVKKDMPTRELIDDLAEP